MNDAIKLLERWIDYYNGCGSSSGLKTATEQWLKQQQEEENRWKPTLEDEERMRQ